MTFELRTKWIFILINFQLIFAQRGGYDHYIVGGVEVPITMYPYVVSILFNGLCSGVIISEQVVLTAGHCVLSSYNLPNPPSIYTIYAGANRVEDAVPYKVRKVIPHPQYMKDVERGEWYDLGLLLLTQKLKFGPNIQKAMLPMHQKWKNKRNTLSVVGYGATDNYKQNLVLKATRMNVVPDKICNRSQSEGSMVLPNHMFCMLGSKWTSDCHGDSGSAVIWRNWVVGTVSTGRTPDCGSDNIPSMYQNLFYFRHWILSTVKVLKHKRRSRLKKKRSPWKKHRPYKRTFRQ